MKFLFKASAITLFRRAGARATPHQVGSFLQRGAVRVPTLLGVIGERGHVLNIPEKMKGIGVLITVLLCLSSCKSELGVFRNLALNPVDTRAFSDAYPHAFSNSETRGDQAFLAINAIDGKTENAGHGEAFPSWGPHKAHEAPFWQVDFGESVLAKELVVYLRADFPHDGWWEKADVVFSDGSRLEIQFEKTAAAQRFELGERKTEFLCIENLKQSEPNTWCGFTEVEVWGR